MNIFGGMKIFWWILLVGHHKIGLFLFYFIFAAGVGSFLCILGSLLKIKVQNRNVFYVFWGLLKFQMLFWVCLVFLIFFFWGGGGANSRSWVQVYIGTDMVDSLELEREFGMRSNALGNVGIISLHYYIVQGRIDF